MSGHDTVISLEGVRKTYATGAVSVEALRGIDIEINRGEYAQPIVGTHYSRVIPGIRTGVPGLYTAAMAQIYPEDRGQNYSIRMGEVVANMAVEDAKALPRVDRGMSERESLAS